MILWVPGGLLLDRGLSWPAKLIWVFLSLEAPVDSHPIPTGRLQASSGLARHTVLRGLGQLESAGWITTNRRPRTAPALPTKPRSGPTESPRGGLPARPTITPNGAVHPPNQQVALPTELLRERRIGIPARLTYGILQLTTGFQDPAGEFRYAELSRLTGLSPNTLIRAVGRLQEAGWIETAQQNKRAPVRFVLRNPVAYRQQREVAAAQRRLQEAPFLGEALMREYLSLLVESDEFEDNASPGYLVNPYTGEEMQFDRYYPPRVAFEFNGPQHYGPTERYADEASLRRQQGRDYMKHGICAMRGVALMVVHPQDLTLEKMREKVSGLLPLRPLGGHEPLIRYLEAVSRIYRRKAHRDPLTEAHGPA